MTHMKRAHAVSRSMDWTAVYIDFKSKHCNIAKYHREYFRDFCIRVGITDVILSHTTVYEHLRQAALFYEAGEQSTETLASNSSVEDPADVPGTENNVPTDHANEEDSDPAQVAIFDLESLIAAASKTEANSRTSSAPASQTVLPFRNLNSGIPKLSIEWSGIKFSYPCLDPGRSLASLLFYLRELEEAHHAY